MINLILDYFGPLMLLAFIINTYVSYLNFKARVYFYVFIAGIINIAISSVFAWSIGPIMMALGVIQIFIGIINPIKVRSTQK